MGKLQQVFEMEQAKLATRQQAHQLIVRFVHLLTGILNIPYRCYVRMLILLMKWIDGFIIICACHTHLNAGVGTQRRSQQNRR